MAAVGEWRHRLYELVWRSFSVPDPQGEGRRRGHTLYHLADTFLMEVGTTIGAARRVHIRRQGEECAEERRAGAPRL